MGAAVHRVHIVGKADNGGIIAGVIQQRDFRKAVFSGGRYIYHIIMQPFSPLFLQQKLTIAFDAAFIMQLVLPAGSGQIVALRPQIGQRDSKPGV